jgi:hypothetical protein
MPPECWPRCRGKSCTALVKLKELLDARIAQIQTGIAKLPLSG